jgi:hypothetical protein
MISQAYFQVSEISKKEILFKSDKMVAKKMLNLDKVDDIEVIRDYIKLTKTIIQ